MDARSWHRCRTGSCTFWPRTPPLRADAVPSGTIDATPAGDIPPLGGRGDLQAPAATSRREDFAAEAQEMFCAPVWRHRRMSRLTIPLHAMPGENGFCTQIDVTGSPWFGTRSSKSRLNFLDLLRAGHTDYVLNDEAYGYMRACSAGSGDRQPGGRTGEHASLIEGMAGASRRARLPPHSSPFNPRCRSPPKTLWRLIAQIPVRRRGAERRCRAVQRRSARCAGCTRNDWCTSWTPSPTSIVPLRRGCAA